MSTPFIQIIVLICLKKINGERTIYSILHLLNGKKSSQTIQDAHLFQLTPYFNTYRDLKRTELEAIVTSLEKENNLTQVSEQSYILTKKGEDSLLSVKEQFPFLRWLNGYENQQSEIFWGRLSLLVQVLSHLLYNKTGYIPIQKGKETQEWVKIFLRKARMERVALSKSLHNELRTLFQGSHQLDPAIIVLRFTGYHAIGLTKKQICDELNIDETLYHFQFLALLHYMMSRIQHEKEDFPLLSMLLGGIEQNPLTNSTSKTYELLRRGYSLEEISKMRKLKLSTIQDHLVELAIQLESFDISSFVSEEKKEKILAAQNESTSKQLKHLRERVPEASYFEIRLVLSKYGEKS